MLNEIGYTQVYALQGGFHQWEALGLPEVGPASKSL